MCRVGCEVTGIDADSVTYELRIVAEAQVAANLARAQRLRQSILQAAFSA